MKRIFALMLAIFSVVSTINVSATYDKLDVSSKTAVLETLGIIENIDENLDEGITRRDFVIAIGKMLGVNIYKVDENRYFKDMTSDDRAWNVANALVDRGILTVGEDRLFRPDDVITTGEVACVLMRILGVRNVEYSVYYDIASSYDIVSGSSATKLRYKDAVEAIYTALNTRTFSNLGESGFRQSGKTLMDVLYDSFYTEGVVNAVNFTSLYGETTYGINTIVVGDTVLSCDLDDAYTYLGCYVSVYYKEVNGVKTLADIFVRETKTDKVTFDIEDFSGFDKDECFVEYYTSGDKLRKLNIDKGVTVIKNGDNESLDISKMFEKIDNGTVTFIDSDRNNVYDIAIVNSYENVVVRYIDTENMKIYGKYSDIDLSDETVPLLIVSVTGEMKSIKDIAPNNVISYYKAENLNRLVISDNTVNGDLTTVNKKNGYTWVKISGTEYVIDKVFIKNSVVTLNTGSTVKALVDAYGKIADMEITRNAGAIYAWLVSTAVEDGMDNRLKIMFFTEDSKLEEIYAATKVSIDGTRCDTIKKIIDALKGENVTADGQLVMIKKNSDGEVNYIDTVNEGGVESGLFVSAEKATHTFFGGQMLLGPKIRLTAESKLFIVPESDKYKTNEEAYMVVNGNKFFVSWKSYSVTAYRNGLKNTVGYTDAMVLERDLIGTKEPSDSPTVFMVKEISDAWDEESMTVKGEVVLLNGKAETVYMCSEDYDVFADANVQVGNIIKVKTNPKGEMVGSSIVFGGDKKDTYNYKNWTSENETACGYVFDIRDGIIGLSLENGAEPFTNLLTANIPVMVYDPSRKESVYVGDEGDLIEAQDMGYKVIVDMARGVTKSFSIVKKR